MKASELRLGNWVEVFFTEDEVGFGKDFYSQITAIQNSKVMVKDDHHWIPIDRIRPAPLTPEILEKAGFRKTGAHSINLQYNLPIGYLWFFGGIAGHCRDINDLSYDTHTSEIKYLHQLQNLYYALTGDEFNINL